MDVYVRASREEVRRAIYSIPKELLSGSDAANATFVSVGEALAARVRQAFVVKSRGGTDDTGERWRDLAPSTKAKRAKPSAKVRAQFRPSYALTDAQRESWWAAYRSALAKYHDKAIAARVAWARLKRSGAQTMFDKYASSQVPILRDSDALYKSLTPGASLNVFRITRGAVTFGTRRRGAGAHHKGGRNLPQRRLWPPVRRWTAEWWQVVLGGARAGIVDMLVEKCSTL